ncbi:MAG: glycosyltransferase [Clostridia bacterium]|nr:glycosyltransferase [Clostridia bacterium]
MKILHFLVTDRLSGAERVHLDILKALKENNEVVYASPDGPIREAVEAEGVRFLPCNTDSIKEIKRLYSKERPNIVNACDPRMSFKCAAAGIPFVSHLHANCPWMSHRSILSYALRYAVKRADAVIAVSDEIADSFVFKKALGDKLFVLPNVVDAEKVIELAKEPCDGEYDLVFVGRLDEVKRPLVFLDVVSRLAERLPGIRAAIVGDGKLRADAEKRKDELGLTNVEIMGFDPNPYRIMARSKINVMTSSYEGFGLVAVEAAILSVPTLAFPSGGITKIASETGFVCLDTDEMVKRAEELLTDLSLYEKTAERAKSASFAHTDTISYIEKIEQIYELNLRYYGEMKL